MTLYLWTHWFWITCKLILCIASAHSKPVTSTSVTNLESFLVANRPLRRNIKSVGQSLNAQSQIPAVTDTTINEILPQLYETNSTVTVNRCIYSLSSMNDTQLFCNHSSSDNLLLTKNLTNTLISDDDVDASSNLTTFLLPTRAHDANVTSTSSISSVSITGITFGVLMFVGLVCATSFVLYRRGLANKPQTLNDKCSNLDSSGYIDDSSMRDNSEEMYSLDNDSFLNSLEAMTIQNYWTDNLKHTKL